MLSHGGRDPVLVNGGKRDNGVCMLHDRRFGIAHIIIATTSEEACRSTVALIQGACCVWQDLEVMKNPVADHAFGGHRLLMQIRWVPAHPFRWRLSITVHNLSLCVVIFESRDNNGMGLALASTRTCRLRLAARTLRLGYNVMFLDTDVIIFDDPYKCVQ